MKSKQKTEKPSIPNISYLCNAGDNCNCAEHVARRVRWFMGNIWVYRTWEFWRSYVFHMHMNKLTIHSTIKLCNIHNIWETKNIKNVVTLSNKKSVCYFASRLSRVVSLVKLDSLTNLPLAGINPVWHYFKVILTPCVDSASKLQHLHTYVICCHSFIRDIYTLIN